MNELICADCGASDPAWASLNHGVLICSDCCFVHRNLGRNISQIRSLTKGMWHDKQLALINYLYKNGANNIWEHTLLDHQGGRTKKKPVSNDPIIPKKESFIIDKYANLAFSIRPAKDEFTVDDLNKQLWSCVRTGHVETSLRLLALGASPNCIIQGNTPIHIAAKNGQDLQVELLWIYGADVEQKNSSGQTPEEIARIEGHNELAKRFMELSFEVTDHFSMFLCGRKPSHLDSHQHFLIPDLVMPRTNHVHDFRRQLQLSNGNVFERLIQDVYDEIDRRELNVQWSTIEQLHIRTHQHVAIFLPPNPKLSATRNQLRQKLAKFSSADFAHLIIDLLKEVRRRYFGLPIPIDEQSPQQITRNIDQIFGSDAEMDETNSPKKSIISTNSNNLMDLSNQNTKMTFSSMDHYLEFKEKLADTDEKMEKLASSNAKILKTLQQIQKSVEQMQIEQSDIQYEMNKMKQQQQRHNISSPPPPPSTTLTSQPQMTPPLQHSTSLTATSTNVPPSKIGAVMMSASTLKPSHSNPQKSLHNYSTDTYPSAKIATRQTSASNLLPTTIQSVQNSNSVAILNQSPQQKKHSMAAKTIFNDEIFPDNLILETELLTNAIKALLSDLQNAPKTSNREANAMYHGDSINHHILRILALIPEHFMRGGPVRQCALGIESAMKQLSRKCLSRPLNIDETCQAAYDIAKTAKELLVTVHGQTEQQH